MILSPLSKFRMISEQWAVALFGYQTLTWRINFFQPGQMMSRSSKVLVTSMLTCLLHPPSISPPAPFSSMSQTNLCLHQAIPLSQTCLFIFGILLHPGDVIFSSLGLGERDAISHHFQEAVQGVSACRWWQFWALFDIRVDLELVSIKWIFILC